MNVFPTQVEEQILKVNALAPHYQIEITRPDNLDEMTINVELSPDADAAAKPPATAELQRYIKDLIGVSAKVNVLDEGAVARSEGKAKRVVDKRKL